MCSTARWPSAAPGAPARARGGAVARRLRHRVLVAHASAHAPGRRGLDRSFVVRMRTDAADAAIVSSTIQLAHTLGMRVVAEGVEDTRRRLSRRLTDGARARAQSRALRRGSAAQRVSTTINVLP